MKRIFIFLCAVILVFAMTGVVSASLTYTYTNNENRWIDNGGSGPASNGWFKMYFPDSVNGTYDPEGRWEYDGYVDFVEFFDIELAGYGDTWGNPIDIFLDFDGTPGGSYKQVASYPVGTSGNPFTLTLDIKNNDLLYNGTDVGDLSNVILQDFVGYDSFYVGYGCHFTHDSTTINVSASSAPVPEPATMLLLGTGLLGHAGVGRKKFKK